MRLNARFSSIRVNAAAFLAETAADLADARLKEEGLWTSKIRILNGGFWHTNRSYRFSLPIWQKRSQNFWTGYSKYSRNTTHWALTSRTIPIRQHTQSSLSIKWCV